MVEIGLALFGVAATAAFARAVLRRRRAARHPRLALLDPRPAGVKHLATRVSELSDFGFRLPATTAFAQRRRLGTLLGLR